MSHEADQPNYLPRPEEVNDAFQSIQDHNRRHSGLGAGMANLFIAMIKAEDKNPDALAEDISATINEEMKAKTVEGDMNGEVQEIIHADTFSRIGMRLAPLGASLGTVGGDRVSSTALEPYIDNVEVFGEFLGVLHPEDVQDGIMPVLGAAVTQLNSIVWKCFHPKNVEVLSPEMQVAAQEIGEDALRTFITIAPAYSRLGLDAPSLRARHSEKPEGAGYLYVAKNAPQEVRDAKAAHDLYNKAHQDADVYETLEAAVVYWGKNLLPEYLQAKGSQYIVDPSKTGFGPAQWHYDGGQRYWPEALAFVYHLQQEERTIEFGQEVRHGLLHALDTAIEAIDSGKEPDYVVGQRGDLANIRNAIAGDDYDAEQFLNYTKRPEW